MVHNTIILFASAFRELSSPWDTEYATAKELGFEVGLYDELDFTTKSDVKGKLVLFRGWMMSFSQYSALCEEIDKKKGIVLVSPTLFKKTNSFSSWYYRIPKYTMKSFFIKDGNKMLPSLKELFLQEDQFFIKDNLKSLGKEKSIARSPQEALDIYKNIKFNRDFEIIDNGICLREVTEITDEERYFILDGEVVPYKENRNESRCALIKKVYDILISKMGMFAFSIDVAKSNGRDIILEIGDFQVSDISKDGSESNTRTFYKALALNNFADRHSS